MHLLDSHDIFALSLLNSSDIISQADHNWAGWKCNSKSFGSGKYPNLKEFCQNITLKSGGPQPTVALGQESWATVVLWAIFCFCFQTGLSFSYIIACGLGMKWEKVFECELFWKIVIAGFFWKVWRGLTFSTKSP